MCWTRAANSASSPRYARLSASTAGVKIQSAPTDGRPFTLTTRKTAAGNTSRSCESLTQVIRQLHDQSGIEASGATAARRTFGVRRKRDGYDLRHICEVLGLSTLAAAKALCEGDPVDLGRIVAKVI